MSKLFASMIFLQEIFDEHAKKDGDPNTLSKKEASDLLRSELMMEPKQVDAEKLFKSLDMDGNGVVSFEEFVTFAAAMTMVLPRKSCSQ
uniref:EF-hand domain-containing protein n=1 Tax=Sparus aurata TaxID=8175 RepID=A0A671W847_SPAAU